MPDRFADGDESNNKVKGMRFPVGADRSDLNVRHGGDLKGINDHIDYLDTLGITALWLNPVLENDMPGGSYHGYATTDYYNVDPRFGTNDDYVKLIDTLHDRDIKTVMDMILTIAVRNMCGSGNVLRLTGLISPTATSRPITACLQSRTLMLLIMTENYLSMVGL